MYTPLTSTLPLNQLQFQLSFRAVFLFKQGGLIKMRQERELLFSGGTIQNYWGQDGIRGEHTWPSIQYTMVNPTQFLPGRTPNPWGPA